MVFIMLLRSTLLKEIRYKMKLGIVVSTLTDGHLTDC